MVLYVLVFKLRELVDRRVAGEEPGNEPFLLWALRQPSEAGENTMVEQQWLLKEVVKCAMPGAKVSNCRTLRFTRDTVMYSIRCQ